MLATRGNTFTFCIAQKVTKSLVTQKTRFAIGALAWLPVLLSRLSSFHAHHFLVPPTPFLQFLKETLSAGAKKWPSSQLEQFWVTVFYLFEVIFKKPISCFLFPAFSFGSQSTAYSR